MRQMIEIAFYILLAGLGIGFIAVVIKVATAPICEREELGYRRKGKDCTCKRWKHNEAER